MKKKQATHTQPPTSILVSKETSSTVRAQQAAGRALRPQTGKGSVQAIEFVPPIALPGFINPEVRRTGPSKITTTYTETAADFRQILGEDIIAAGTTTYEEGNWFRVDAYAKSPKAKATVAAMLRRIAQALDPQ